MVIRDNGWDSDWDDETTMTDNDRARRAAHLDYEVERARNDRREASARRRAQQERERQAQMTEERERQAQVAAQTEQKARAATAEDERLKREHEKLINRRVLIGICVCAVIVLFYVLGSTIT